MRQRTNSLQEDALLATPIDRLRKRLSLSNDRNPSTEPLTLAHRHVEFILPSENQSVCPTHASPAIVAHHILSSTGAAATGQHHRTE
jgi:hypothetical protein